MEVSLSKLLYLFYPETTKLSALMSSMDITNKKRELRLQWEARLPYREHSGAGAKPCPIPATVRDQTNTSCSYWDGWNISAGSTDPESFNWCREAQDLDVSRSHRSSGPKICSSSTDLSRSWRATNQNHSKFHIYSLLATVPGNKKSRRRTAQCVC